MSSINLEFGFNVPRKVIYDAFVDQMYLTFNEGKLSSTQEQKHKFKMGKEAIFQFSMAESLANSWPSALESILKWSGNLTIGRVFQ